MSLRILDIPKLALQRQGSAIFGVLVIGIVWAGVGLMFRSDLQQDYYEVERRNENYALLFEDNILRSIGEIDKAILYLRRSVEASKDTVDYQTIVQTTDVLSEIIVQVAIIDKNGLSRATNAVPTPTKPIDISDRPHFKAHVNSDSDKLFISKPLIGRASGKWSVQFTRRFSNKDGSFAGVVVASMNPMHFTSFYDKVKLGTATSVAMIGSDGVVRSQGGIEIPQFALGNDLSRTDTFKRISSGVSNTFIRKGREVEEDLLVVSRQVRGHSLWVTVSTKENAIYVSTWTNLRYNVGIAACLTILILIALEHILRAEGRAVQKAQLLQLTLEHIGQGIMFVTRDRKIPIFNQRCAELLRIPDLTTDSGLSLEQLQKLKPDENLSRIWADD